MTPAIRLAESAGIAFELHRYTHDPKAEAYGLEAAEKLGVAPERVWKTLVARGDDAKALVLTLIPSDQRLDLKKLAHALKAKKADMADPQAAQRATGYVLGGISPLGGKKSLPTYIDPSIANQTKVLVSAGQRGLQIELAVEDLVHLTNATLVELLAK